MKNLLILTSHFPYEGGEQFIETEINFWKGSQFKQIYLLPTKKNKKVRNFPDEFILLEDCTLKQSKFNKLLFLICAFFSSFFWREIFYIILSNEKKTISSFYDAFILSGNVVRCKMSINKAIKKMKGDIFVYSYWNDVQFYASCLLKKDGKIKKIISRAHGGDLYQERRRNNYMPLKRQFRNSADRVYLLSDTAKKYYISTYNYPSDKLCVARLGVKCGHNILKYESCHNKIRLLSLSYCVKVKRIDKIIDSILKFALKNKDYIVEWTHVGDGPLFNYLVDFADKKLKNLNNVRMDFKGYLPNGKVRKLLTEQNFDMFINVSESEGIPVSIMEAMSFGIPAIAPTIGGIPDLINSENGWLLSKDSTIDEIVNTFNCIKECMLNDEIKTYRVNARKWVEKHYNSEKNYQTFVKNVQIDFLK